MEPEKKLAYKQMMRDSKIDIGDFVKVAKSAKSREKGWGDYWFSAMDEAVGNVYMVEDINEFGYKLNTDKKFVFPVFVLEKM